ncbi:MAG: helix-turn-helix domain-containing protein [Planctomycetota bacterium]
MARPMRKTTPDPMQDRDILNIDGAAAFLGVSIKTFSKVLREGDVPGRKVGREWKFARQALIEWVSSTRSRAFLDGDDGEPEDGGETPSGRPSPRTGGGAPRRETKAEARRRRAADGFSVDELG